MTNLKYYYGWVTQNGVDYPQIWNSNFTAKMQVSFKREITAKEFGTMSLPDLAVRYPRNPSGGWADGLT